MKEILGHYVMVGDTRTFYDECGTGIPFIGVHTAGMSALQYRYFLPILAENGFRGIALDLPGHSKSYPVNWEPIRTMHGYAEFLWSFIEKVAPGEKPIVMGCSIGGDIVIDLACYHSENCRAIISLEGAAYTTATFPDVRESEFRHANPGWHAFHEWMSIESLSPTVWREKGDELRWIARAGAGPQVGSGDLIGWNSQDVRDKLKNIKCPILLTKGEEDYYVPGKLVSETVAGIKQGLAESVVLPNTGHFPMFERPEETFKVTMEFLKRKKVV